MIETRWFGPLSMVFPIYDTAQFEVKFLSHISCRNVVKGNVRAHRGRGCYQLSILHSYSLEQVEQIHEAQGYSDIIISLFSDVQVCVGTGFAYSTRRRKRLGELPVKLDYNLVKRLCIQLVHKSAVVVFNVKNIMMTNLAYYIGSAVYFFYDS